ncbi:hypothetical protein HEP85_40675 [Streptomyces sp. RPA4-2]|uniref:hypothetical protein n=1 Tax=Streptomyces sp. RPA4-2 TaxID=2721244 RepID=UPI00143E3FE9|nr:hypothetical protein [Streptomyces sp. RPA4-2]QIY66629.1 hypothetical protein HEP85_40675 [Streptomyces sp. RPA4-2]
MLFLGLLLLAATAAFTGLAISDNLGGGPDYTVSVLGNDIATMSVLMIFCAGLALALIFSLGLWMTAGGAMHRRRRTMRIRNERDAMAAQLSARGTATRPQGPTDAATGQAGAAEPTPWASAPAATPEPRHRSRRIHLFGH